MCLFVCLFSLHHGPAVCGQQLRRSRQPQQPVVRCSPHTPLRSVSGGLSARIKTLCRSDAWQGGSIDRVYLALQSTTNVFVRIQRIPRSLGDFHRAANSGDFKGAATACHASHSLSSSFLNK